LARSRAPGGRERQPFEPFIAALEHEAEQFGRPVLLVHGDGHRYIVDHPLENLTRLEVPGSYDVGWVWVAITPDAQSLSPFVFEAHVVPRWKYW
jgi:hypothetical protein